MSKLKNMIKSDRMKGMKCQKCKGADHLSKLSIGTNGIAYYICRKCNTERLKKYRGTPEGRKKTFAAIYKNIKKNPEKHNARAKVFQAIKRGELCRPDKCEICLKNSQIFAHHEDYARPLDVMWLCRNCHISIHN